MRKVFLLILVLASCTEGTIISEYQSVDVAGWDKNDMKAFTFSPPDTLNAHHVFLHIRNDDSFPFSNLFLITEMTFPGGVQLKDTLEYTMADPSGKWLGSGAGSIRENKLWYKENIVFPARGVYTIRIGHAMRQNGAVNGIEKLQGITDVGIEIEQAE